MHPFERVSLRPGDGRWGRDVRYFASLPSTNDEAMNEAAAGAPNGLLVVADAQTRGRGRHGRSWIAPSGQNLLASWVVRPQAPAATWSRIPLAAALAVADVVEEVLAGPRDGVGPDAVRVKWPNDVRVNGRKVSGILAESRLDSSGAGYVVLGIGLNVNQVEFAPELSGTATSLALAAGRTLDRAEVLGRLCDVLEHRVEATHGPGDAMMRVYRARLEGIGRNIRLHMPGGGATFEGRMHGVDDDGALVLEVDGGLRTFQAGEVTLRPA